MTSPAGELRYGLNEPASDEQQQPAAKRQKTQACSRCRRRKQKCNDERPCTNCARAGEECVEVMPASFYRPSGSIASPHMPLAWLGDIASLEERISRLEDTNAQANLNRTTNINGAYPDAPSGSLEKHQSRRVSWISRTEPEGGLTRSSPAIGLLATFARSEAENQSPLDLHESAVVKTSHETVGAIDSSQEEVFFETYEARVHCRYPFLRLTELRDVSKRPTAHWVGYFINMIYSIGLLLGKSNHIDAAEHSQQTYYRLAVTRYLSHVFAEPDRLLHIQAYLLLAMHAIYSPSTERIISIASATMRYCVMAQLHLAEAEPSASDALSKVHIQMRRRVFWSAYALDRAVGTAFDLPFSIPDYQITVKLYANINDSELEERCAEVSTEDAQNRPRFTNVSFALHVVYCRQIQSEILNTTLHRDFGKQFDRLSHWRLRVLGKLDRWKSLCHRYADSRSETYVSGEWLHMIYNYSLAMLYQPNKSTVAGPAGDWTVKSCVQACLIFRKFQRETPISELWLGLIVQFKCGVALLYCFFATAPHLRSEAYELPSASEAVRACSIILSILAERWPQSRCVRDAFDILSREIPLYELPPSGSARLPQRMRRESAEALMALMTQLETIIVHRSTLRMIKEMALEEFPRPRNDGQNSVPQIEAAADRSIPCPDGDSPSLRTSITGDMFQPSTPYFFQPDVSSLDPDGFDYMTIGFPGEFDPQISF